MAVPVDNVIRFPDGVRGSVADYDRNRLLVEARDRMAHKLREAFRSVLPRVEEDLLSRGDVADGREQRQLYYGTKDVLHDNAVRLEGLLAARWIRLFDQKQRGGEKPGSVSSTEPDELQLVDLTVMDEELAVRSIAGKLRDGCEDGLFATGRRLAYLAGQDGDASLPVEDLMAQALDGAFEDVGLDRQARLEVLHSMEMCAVEIFGPPIHDLNNFLIGRGVLPKLRRVYSRAERKRAVSDEKPPQDAGDVFALLQKLVASGPAGGAAGSAGGMPGGIGTSAGGGDGMTGFGTGQSGGGATAGGMAVAMERVMKSLDVLQRVVPVATVASAPMVNVLHEFRNSDTGQNLGYLDAVTVDIVATLFDFIFDDPAVADPIKALVARLQIPVLKVAMLDKTFFSTKAHPARRLLDGISRAAIRCGPNAGHEDPLYARISEIVERLQNEFSQDTSLFDTLCHELDEFLDSQEEQADARAAQAAPLVAAQEQRELASIAADQALSGWLSMPLPSVVSDLLSHEWRALLIQHYLSGDDAAWGAAMGTISDLVASVQPQTEVQGRKQLAARLPTLVRRIHEGLDGLKVGDERRLMLIDALFSLHAAVLRGSAPVVTNSWPSAPAAEPAPVQIASERIEDGDTQLERISLAEGGVLPETPGSDDAQAQVADLQRGDWVEFVSAEADPVRYRLSWISPQRGILLFTNPHSPKAISVAPDALALQIERGEAAVVSDEPMFDRAVSRALETLKAA